MSCGVLPSTYRIPIALAPPRRAEKSMAEPKSRTRVASMSRRCCRRHLNRSFKSCHLVKQGESSRNASGGGVGDGRCGVGSTCLLVDGLPWTSKSSRSYFASSAFDTKKRSPAATVFVSPVASVTTIERLEITSMSGDVLGNNFDKLRFIRLGFELASADGKEGFVGDGFLLL